MTYYIDKIKITHGDEEGDIVDSCPFWKAGLDSSYCNHPKQKNLKLKCNYGLSDVKVPERCPLRKGELTTKIQVLLDHEEANFG